MTSDDRSADLERQVSELKVQRDELLAALDVLRDRVIDEYDRIYISGVIGKVQP